MPYLALQGVRVVELATGISGPFCGKLLADYGAEVIKVEPPDGDPSRKQGSLPDDKPDIEKSGLFLHLNTNKKSVTLDLETHYDREQLKRLVRDSHIVIESFKPGWMASLGLGYDVLRQLRPDVVVTSITPFGQTGPHKDYEFTELTLFAVGGAMHREGLSDREPLRYGGEIAQYFAGGVTAVATIAASKRAWSAGVGEWIDLSIQECVAGHPHQIGRRAPFAYGGELDPRRTPQSRTAGGHDAYATGTYKCKDGYVSFLPLGPRMWPSFCNMIGRPEFVDDPCFADREGRRENYFELQDIFQSWLDARTRDEVFIASQEARVPGGPVLMIDEVKENAHFKARGFFKQIDHPDAGKLVYPGYPFRLSNVPEKPQKSAPRLGQHNDEVLGRELEKSHEPDNLRQTPQVDSSKVSLPLKGVRALELGEVWAGPFCGTLLADLGAELTKIESIQRFYRGAIRPPEDAPGYPYDGPGERPWNRFANYNAVNRNKSGITLDLTSPKGAETFKELVSVSDVVFSNYVFGVLDSFGLGYDELRKVRPDLIMVIMPGYGSTGPYRRYRSMGMTIDAITGHSSLRGYPDLDSSYLSFVHHPDAVAGITAAFAISTALHYRDRTGNGQLIDLAQSEAFITHMGEIFLEHSITGRVRERRGNRHPGMAPHGCYPCLGDDKWVTIAVRDEKEWRDFCAVIGKPSMIDDERFADLKARLKHHDDLDAIISKWTSSRDRYEITGLLQARGIPAGPVLDCGADTYDDPHLQEREYFETVTHPESGTYPLSGEIWKMANSPRYPQRPAPLLGQHNPYVLGEILGIAKAALKDLEDEKIIGTMPLEGADMGGARRIKKE